MNQAAVPGYYSSLRRQSSAFEPQHTMTKTIAGSSKKDASTQRNHMHGADTRGVAHILCTIRGGSDRSPTTTSRNSTGPITSVQLARRWRSASPPMSYCCGATLHYMLLLQSFNDVTNRCNKSSPAMFAPCVHATPEPHRQPQSRGDGVPKFPPHRRRTPPKTPLPWQQNRAALSPDSHRTACCYKPLSPPSISSLRQLQKLDFDDGGNWNKYDKLSCVLHFRHGPAVTGEVPTERSGDRAEASKLPPRQDYPPTAAVDRGVMRPVWRYARNFPAFRTASFSLLLGRTAQGSHLCVGFRRWGGCSTRG